MNSKKSIHASVAAALALIFGISSCSNDHDKEMLNIDHPTAYVVNGSFGYLMTHCIDPLPDRNNALAFCSNLRLDPNPHQADIVHLRSLAFPDVEVV
jgi:hypothetical protein